MKEVNPKLLDPASRDTKNMCADAYLDLDRQGLLQSRELNGSVEKACVSGADFSSWLLENHYCETKIQTSQVGGALLRAGILTSVSRPGESIFRIEASALYKMREVETPKRTIVAKIFGRSVSMKSKRDGEMNRPAPIFNAREDPSCDSAEQKEGAEGISRSSVGTRSNSQSCRIIRSTGARASLEVIRSRVPGYEERQMRKQLKENTKRNRSQVSRGTQLRVLNSSDGLCDPQSIQDMRENLSDGKKIIVSSISQPSMSIDDDDMFPLQRLRSIQFSETIKVREIAKKDEEEGEEKAKPTEYEEPMDPDDLEPRATAFPVIRMREEELLM